MKVLFVASEAYPFIKTGGLGDVAYALPKALRKLGIDVRVIIPKYEQIDNKYVERMEKISEFTIPVGWRNQYCGLLRLDENGIPFYFIDNEYYFKRAKAYGDYDDGEKFSFFSKAVLELLVIWKILCQTYFIVMTGIVQCASHYLTNTLDGDGNILT
jgi:starch synthase